MGLMRWMRGGDDTSATASVISAGLSEIDGLFRPSKHKQTEFIAESKRKRLDVANGSDIDLDSGRAVIRSVKNGTGTTAERTPRVHVPRRTNWWKRLRTTMHRRKVARVKARTTR
ncbi:MAG TPA: hypothetical protein VHA75_16055 [Rugosimonospora sp.]|nr:hypothetical protein [Rugosimonospora sp.]